MTHPDPQDWIAYLYREVDKSTGSRLKTHLATCDTCRAQIAQWQQVRQHLDLWKLSTVKPPTRFVVPPLVRWAGAALLMITLGFALGRSSGASREEVAALREQWRGELAQMVKAQVESSAPDMLTSRHDQLADDLRQFINFYQSERQADNQAISAALARLDAARSADYLSLRKDLETVALNSDAGLRLTRQQLVRLADYSQANTPAPPY